MLAALDPYISERSATPNLNLAFGVILHTNWFVGLFLQSVRLTFKDLTDEQSSPF